MPDKSLVMGDRICRGEATQIYFSNQDDVLTPSAIQVLAQLSNALIRCPRRKIVLLAVSGDDGAPAYANVSEQRLYRVRATLLERGLAEARFDPEATLAPHVTLPKGPIGGVVVVTRR
jgi:outer membrane protein OmpA-like peptidoglycan-associated protein